MGCVVGTVTLLWWWCDVVVKPLNCSENKKKFPHPAGAQKIEKPPQMCYTEGGGTEMSANRQYGISIEGQERHIDNPHKVCYGLCGVCAPWMAYSKEEKKYFICASCQQIVEEVPK